MKNKASLWLLLTVALTLAIVSSVSAQNNKGNQGKNPNVAAADNTAQAADTTAIQEKGKKDKTKDNKGQINAESHRSAVASFVQSLLAVADREGGIGQQVRVVAQQQNGTKDKVAESIDKVEKRSKLKSFLIGTDYKNTGALRSEMVQTRNRIAQLKRMADKAENDQDKNELQNQIQVLEQEQTNIESFITQNEDKFSLFGWAVKLFQ